MGASSTTVPMCHHALIMHRGGRRSTPPPRPCCPCVAELIGRRRPAARTCKWLRAATLTRPAIIASGPATAWSEPPGRPSSEVHGGRSSPVPATLCIDGAARCRERRVLSPVIRQPNCSGGCSGSGVAAPGRGSGPRRHERLTSRSRDLRRLAGVTSRCRLGESGRSPLNPFMSAAPRRVQQHQQRPLLSSRPPVTASTVSSRTTRCGRRCRVFSTG